MYQVFYVNKSTDTVADINLAYGVCQLISHLLPDGAGITLTLADRGSLYMIELDQPLADGWIEQTKHRFISLNPFIQTSSKTALQAPPGMSDVINYDVHKARNDAWWAALKKLSGKDRQPDQARALLYEQGVGAPHPNWPIWALINQQKAIKAYDKLVLTWEEHRGELFPWLLRLTLDLFADPLNDVDAAQAAWAKVAREHGLSGNATETAPQIVDPGMGKGSHYSKATRVSEGNLEGFWLLEYLRFAGLYAAGVSLVVQGSKDRKIYLPLPNRMTWDRATEHILSDYRAQMYSSTAIKLDVLAALRYMHIYLKHWLDAQDSDDDFGWGTGQPGDHARAIGVVFLKDMGSSHAVMRMNELNLPRWVQQVETVAEGRLYQEVIEEHLRVIGSLNESHGDEYALLDKYRRFLSSGDLRAFLDFTRGYGALTISRMNTGEFAPQFTLPNLEVVLMASDRTLKPILENEGFQAVADAIRRSTVMPQRRKGQGQGGVYDIRYGLGDKLMRAAPDRNRFVRELTEFLHQYNRETAQVFETRKVQYRKSVTTEHIDQLIDLIDEYNDPELIAGLLVAYGYARDPNVGQQAEPDEDNAEIILEENE